MAEPDRNDALRQIAQIVGDTRVSQKDDGTRGLKMVLVLDGPDYALNGDLKQVLHETKGPDNDGYALYSMPAEIAATDRTMFRQSPAMARANRDVAQGAAVHTVIMYPGLANENLSMEDRCNRFHALNAHDGDICASAAVHLLPIRQEDLAEFRKAAPDLVKDARHIRVPAKTMPHHPCPSD